MAMEIVCRRLYRLLLFNSSRHECWNHVSWQRQCTDAKLVRCHLWPK